MHLELRFYLFHLLEMSATVSNEHFIGIRFALMVDDAQLFLSVEINIALDTPINT